MFNFAYHCFRIDPVGLIDATTRAQQRISNIADFAWKTKSKGAQAKAAKALGSARTDGQVRKFLAELDKGLASQLSESQAKNVASAIQRTYKTAKAIASKEAGIKGVVNAADKVRSKKIADSVGRWMDRFYGEHLREHVENVAFDIFADPGVALSDRSGVIKKAIKQELSLSGGKSDVGKLRPAPFAGNVGNYTNLTADVANHQARVMALISAYSDAGVTRYRLRAILDDRTSDICRRLHGQVFELTDAEGQIERMLDAVSPDDAKAAAPWKSDAEIQQIIGPARRGSRDAADRLRAAGASVLPPFHGNCRTVPELL